MALAVIIGAYFYSHLTVGVYVFGTENETSNSKSSSAAQLSILSRLYKPDSLPSASFPNNDKKVIISKQHSNGKEEENSNVPDAYWTEEEEGDANHSDVKFRMTIAKWINEAFGEDQLSNESKEGGSEKPKFDSQGV